MSAATVEPAWILDAAGLAPVLAALAKAQSVAIDTESNSRFVYRERICLVQLNLDGRLFLLDPLAFDGPGPGWAPLAKALDRPDLTVLLHGGEYDIACLKRDHGSAPAQVWDTQQAAALLGLEQTGYGALVAQLAGVQLAKEHAQYDWAQRPIDAAALTYAVDDVRYLPQLVAELRTRIAAADLEEELAIANAAVAGTDAHRGGYDPQGIYRIKGVGRLRPPQLGLLSALYAWRDQVAVTVNLPPGRIVNNESLLELARLAPHAWSQLRSMNLHRQTLQRYGDQVLECIKEHRHHPPTPPEPPARREPDPRERDREQALKDWRRTESERRGVTLQAVLPARSIDHLKKHGAGDLDNVPQLGAKRIRLYASALRQVLAPLM